MQWHLLCTHKKDLKIHFFPFLSHALTVYLWLLKFSDFVLFSENLRLIIQKATWQFFVVVLFKILFNVVLPFSSPVKILACDFPTKSY